MKRPSFPLIALWAVAALLLGAGALAASLERSPDGVPVGAPGPEVATASVGLESSFQQPAQTNLREQGSGGLDTPLLPRLRSLLGMILLGLLAWAFSVDRSKLAWRV
ncbi:MAG: hypothetical protein ABIF09_09400, partial [Gemmatimonadota bacterium]